MIVLLQLINICVPNSPTERELLTIITGDLNCVLDSKLDRFPVGKSKY